jgi:DNA-binding transcriptional MerR regulator
MARNVGFSTPEVARATGLTDRQIGYWAKTGFCIPTVADTEGRGNHRRYDVRDVFTFAVLGELRHRGVSLQSLRQVQRYIRGRDGKAFPDVHARLVWAPGNRRFRHDVALVHTDAEIISLLTEPGQRIAPVVVDVAELYRQTRERIEEIRRSRKTKTAAKTKQKAGKASAKQKERAA